MSDILVSIALAFGAFALFKVFRVVWREWSSPLRFIPGPAPTSLLMGNMREIMEGNNNAQHDAWIEQYGKTFKYTILLQMKRLFTTDHKAIAHVLAHDQMYQKPDQIRRNLAQLLGEGLLFVEGEQHKQQRRIMNPAFGPVQIRALTEVFVEKANQLKDRWTEQYAQRQAGTDLLRIEALSWLGRMTLDVIGLAGFEYNFDALHPEGKENDLSDAFSTVYKAGASTDLLSMLSLWIPILRRIPTKRTKSVDQARQTMDRIGRQLLAESKAAIAAGDSNSRRDLLSLLVKANTSKDVPEHMRLSDEDVLAQVPSFLVAGHETSSTGTGWTLFALSQNLEAQNKLRREILGLDVEDPDMDQLNALPYLDAVLRETMRLHSPVPSTARVATQDDLIPLDTPYTDTKGVVHHHIRVAKGDTVVIPILTINRSKAIWGEDAKEFKPERWLQPLPEQSDSVPGIWSHQLTFLAGPRACIGYKFSIIEMKALLFTLVKSFQFELAVPASDIVAKRRVVQRPTLASDPAAGYQLPLLIKPYVA